MSRLIAVPRASEHYPALPALPTTGPDGAALPIAREALAAAAGTGRSTTGEFSAWHWVVVAISLVGTNKLPDLARSLGQSARILKAEARSPSADGKKPADRSE